MQEPSLRLARLEEALPLGDGVIVLEQHRTEDVAVYLQNPPLPGDLFWPVAMEQDAIEGWLAGRDVVRRSLLLAIRAGASFAGGIEVRVLTPEIGALDYWVFPAFRSAGFATRAVSIARDALRTHCGVAIVQMRIREQNHASLAVARRVGFEEVERNADEILFYG